MKEKYYGLTKQQNEGVKDNAPNWMDDLFKKDRKVVASNENPFKDVDNLYMAGKKTEEVNKCEFCGAVLSDDEVEVCKNCL